MGTRTTPALLEREAELDALQESIEEGADGTGRLVVIEGEAGIGKSRLLEAAAESAERSGMEVLSARGTELERDFPFALMSQLFGPPVRAAGDAERDQILDEAARPAAPVIGIEPGDVGAGPLPDRSFGVLNPSSGSPPTSPSDGLYSSVDDVQWSDQGSLRFLIFLLPPPGRPAGHAGGIDPNRGDLLGIRSAQAAHVRSGGASAAALPARSHLGVADRPRGADGRVDGLILRRMREGEWRQPVHAP